MCRYIRDRPIVETRRESTESSRDKLDFRCQMGGYMREVGEGWWVGVEGKC